ncbi:hypothetical protein [Streptomyces huiliensis]|uniref:hypothetical protein n=1 Tax=Streptomyces huiliensis TaxID=2876027 RepID=UPI001CBB6C29|nr:hypothetical protein [Streptomyces huiliensis]MBZ4320157.1 hypothetical protein [Streptomyces huiliensis]
MDRAGRHTDDIVWSAEEYDAVGAAVAGVTGTGAHSLNSLLAQWSALVDDVEEGYSWCAPELSHDLWCRDTLAGVWPLLPSRVRALRQPELDCIDERYRRATVPWPGRPEEGAQWWTWRVPRRLEVEASERRDPGWPLGWETMPFPRPASVEVVAWN